MRRLLPLALTLLLVSACSGDDDDAEGSATTGAPGTSSVSEPGTLNLPGGATFRGTFTVEPGVGPGEMSLVLDSTGTLIVSSVLDPALNGFACPTGVTISGGGTSGTYIPGIAIESGVFESRDLSGVFDTATTAHGTYNLFASFDCPYELTWTATSE